MSDKEVTEFKTVLIFGVETFIGSNLAEYFSQYYRVIGTYFEAPVRFKGILTLRCDVLNRDEVQRIIFTFRPDIVVYGLGVRTVSECADNPEFSALINNDGLYNVVEFSQRYKALVCGLTSQYVFSGVDRDYIEMDIPDPDTILGKNQSAAEFFIQKSALSYLIFRCCYLYGRNNRPNKETFFEIMQRKILKGETVGLDKSVYSGFLDIMFLATLMRMCFENSVSNRLFQVSSSDVMSMFDFAKTYIQVFKQSDQSVISTKWDFPLESGLKSPDRKLSYKLENVNIENFLNINMPTVKQSLEFTFQRLNGSQKKSGTKSSGDGINYI